MKLLIEPHYLGSIEYFSLITRADELVFEINQHFTKQSFKNRCVFLTANGEQTLSIPVSYGNRTPFKEVKIDQSQSWLRVHWGSFSSAYGKSPFYEFFEEQFHTVWFAKHRYLIDLNLDMMTLCLSLLQIDRPLKLTEIYDNEVDAAIFDIRELILPKTNYTDRTFYCPEEYDQVFGNKFVSNLSIIDLIMNEGSNALNVLKKSIRKIPEQL